MFVFLRGPKDLKANGFSTILDPRGGRRFSPPNPKTLKIHRFFNGRKFFEPKIIEKPKVFFFLRVFPWNFLYSNCLITIILAVSIKVIMEECGLMSKSWVPVWL